MSTLQARNEIVVNAPIKTIWTLITDIYSLQRVNPWVEKASGRMDIQGQTRTCDFNNNGRKGTMTEKLVELVPEKKTVWTIESDTMGMSKMLKDTRFCFYLEKLEDHKTKVINESYYRPATLMAKIMNGLIMKKQMRKIQSQMLTNIKSITEK